MKFNITPFYSFPFVSFSPFSVFLYAQYLVNGKILLVEEKNSSSIAKMFVLFQRLTIGKRDLLGVEISERSS
jgi:hypothetical protein